MPTVTIETHGCKLNLADSQALARGFARAGYQVVGSDQPADIYVLDTCTVTQTADHKARHALRAARRRNASAFIVATGCYAQRAPAKLQALPGVDLVLGNADKDALVQEIVSLRACEEIMDSAYGGTPPQIATGGDALAMTIPSQALRKDVPGLCAAEEGVAGRGVRRVRATVKIQEGCNQVCAYCIVPRVRGRERSVPADDLVTQIAALEQEGFQEVVLTGTQVGSYGFDIPGASLPRLLELVLCKTTIPRIRVSSLQAQVVGGELLGLWQDPRLCPHFHMPLQSGCDAVLRHMGRDYTTSFFADTVELIRKQVPGASITTDVMTGFPGESEEEFQETYRFCHSLRFAEMHVFPYSVRPGTSAAHFQDQVDVHTKEHRGGLLLRLAKEHAADFRESLLGQVRPVLWERKGIGSGCERWSGLTDNYMRVFTESPKPLRNTITPTRLLEERGGSLYGQVVY
ncbi:MAG: tRNA (N(6)-L-threonylcarbamoyladenosine(37)-C(2))-methylthiotransferase MtaB [Chloroflexi bacterium]|nr:tRNA (N(6)-L-threonylcarbamoyladenosine(37)-C(2))-methylthiotransferase MtaB [Chloroflexota bacterium]